MKNKRNRPYSPHYWIHCKVHGVIPVHRDFGEDVLNQLIEEHERHGG